MKTDAIAFFVLQLIGLVGTTVIFLTAALSRHVQRYAAWFNLVLAYIIACFSYSLLPLTNQALVPVPAFGVCFTQSILIYMAPMLVAFTAVGLVIRIWFDVTDALYHTAKIPTYKLIAIIVVPHILAVVFTLFVTILAVQSPDNIRLDKTQMYCGNRSGSPGKIVAALVFISMSLVICLEVMMGFRLHRHRELLPSFKDRYKMPSFVMYCRLVVFSLINLVALSVAWSWFWRRENEFIPRNIVLSTLPLAFILVFGTQTDLIRCWTFRNQQSVMVSDV